MALSYVQYSANGSTDQFSVTFNYIDSSHVKVYVDNVEDTTFTWVNTSLIETSSTPTNGQVVKIDRDTPTTSRLVDFQDGSTLTETDLDKSANQNFYAVQENVDSIGDCLKLDNTGVYDADSKRIINVATPTSGTDAANKTYIDTQTTSAATSATAAATSATAAATSATASASSATASATSATAANTAKTAAETAETNAETAETNAETAETNAETAETNAAASATTATTKATAAASSATAASSSASTASTQASNASTSATAAASSATAAASSATSAASSATSAASAQTAAEAALDTFDDKYLGAKSSAPTLDNDGDALTDGALYYLTTTNIMYTYDLGTTTWLALKPSSSEQTNINTVSGSIANVNTTATNIAGVNSFAERYRVGSSDPASSNDEGDLAYNSTSNNLKYYNGSSWVTIVAGSLTDVVGDGSPQLGGDLDINSNDITGTGNIAITGYVNARENWESKDDDFTAAAGKSYFCDTTSNNIDVTLPSGVIGDEIRFLDVSGTFDTNDLTVLYGSTKIQGASANLDVGTERAGFALVYYNATQGWLLKDK